MAKLEVQYVYRHLVATRYKRNEPPARPGSDRAGVWYMGDPATPWSPPATPGAPPWSGFVAFHQLAFCSPGRSRGHICMLSPKGHCELAGSGIEYDWGKMKMWQYRHI